MNELPETKLFYCQHILEADNLYNLLETFTVNIETGKGLENYIKYSAVEDEKNGRARTYLVRDKVTHEVVGYFSLKAGMISFNERLFSVFGRTFDSVSGIELANFAVNSSYKEAHMEFEGLGMILFNYFILPIVDDVSVVIGARYLYIFALPYSKLINNYKNLNFSRLPFVDEFFIHRRMKPRYDKNCIFMCQVI